MLNFDWLAGIPMDVAVWIFLSLFILIGILVMFVPREFIYQGVEHPRWWHNLKIWAIGDLVLIFLIYYIFY